jgi:hypothetical protein
MDWLWRGGEGPREIPHWAYMYLVTSLMIDPDHLTHLKCVEQMDFEGDTLLNLIRIFDPKSAERTVRVKNFASLDQHPDLILFEGHLEKESGRVHITSRRAVG